MTELRRRMEQDMLLRNYSVHTRKNYVRYVQRFAEHYGRPPDLLGPEDVRR
jgi:hypothetical protein